MDQRLNWLRAGVLGANDGIVSTAGVVIGVAGATSQTFAIATAGIAALVAGAFSMAGGEYVSVSTQRDTERALLAKEQWELDTMPDTELKELTDIYVDRGVTPDVAALVARDLTARDPLRAHAEAELGIDPDDLTNPWLAAVSSLVSFSVGAAIPLIAILLPLSQAVLICVLAVALALAITGLVSAHLGGAPKVRAVLRNIGMGLLTMA
ncbi:VIT1/CCC1 transporter family protein, partial [Acidipropionibacterium jensenii]